MFRVSLAGLLGVFLVAGSAAAIDLTTIERKIVKAPEFKTQAPEYCLLVFGPDAQKRVWLIHDGDTLYVDRNGNGDLTEADERVAGMLVGKEADREFAFQVGSIPDAPRSHECFDIVFGKFDFLRDKNPFVREALEADPNFHGCGLHIDVAMDGQRGLGVDGRVTHYVTVGDLAGLLRFSSRPEDAPILHFGGPWQVTLTQPQVWQAGRMSKVDVALATPGVGAGSTAYVAYGRVVPLTIDPTLRVEYASGAAGGNPITETYKLTSRCCGTTLYGDVRVPESAAAGKATMKISLKGAIGFFAASTTHEITITPARPRPSLEPVSARLKSRLKFSQPCRTIGQIVISPDSKRLIASAYPDGVINLWNLGNEQPVAVIKSDGGLRQGSRYCRPSTDWRTLLVPTNEPEVLERITKNGETLYHSEFADGIEVFDLPSGKLLRTVKDAPPQGSLSLWQPYPAGYVITSGYLAGEFKGRGPRITTLWNEGLTESREIGRGDFRVEALSADGLQAIVSVGPADPARSGNTIRVLRSPQFDEERTLLTAPASSTIDISSFASGGKTLIGSVTTWGEPRDFQHSQSTFKAWDFASGNELVSIPWPAGCRPDWSFASPDGQSIVVVAKNEQSFASEVLLLGGDLRTTKSLRLPKRTYLDGIVFHPMGSWFALSTQEYPKDVVSANAMDLPQPRLLIVDARSGEIIETLVSPRAQLQASTISPDGAILATSGDSEVLIWDVSDFAARVASRVPATKNTE